jgi:N-methylhydantoinase B/oxoprolinase/acetone carboxylase alpha subunit
MAAVLYVFRTLVADEIPLNAGCMKPLKVIIPARSMLNPEPPASGGGGQRRDLDLHHQRALRRARRDGARRSAR